MTNNEDNDVEKNNNNNNIHYNSSSIISSLINNSRSIVDEDDDGDTLDKSKILQKSESNDTVDEVDVDDDDDYCDDHEYEEDLNRIAVRIKATIAKTTTTTTNRMRPLSGSNSNKIVDTSNHNRPSPPPPPPLQDFLITIHLNETVTAMKHAVIDAFLSSSTTTTGTTTTTTTTTTDSNSYSGGGNNYHSYYVRLIASGRLLTPDTAYIHEFQQQFQQCNQIVHAVIMESNQIYKHGAQALLQKQQTSQSLQPLSTSLLLSGGRSLSSTTTGSMNLFYPPFQQQQQSQQQQQLQLQQQQQQSQQYPNTNSGNSSSSRNRRRDNNNGTNNSRNGLLRGTGVNESGWAIPRSNNDDNSSSSYSSSTTNSDDDDDEYHRYDDITTTSGRYRFNLSYNIVDTTNTHHDTTNNPIINLNHTSNTIALLEDDANSIVLDDVNSIVEGCGGNGGSISNTTTSATTPLTGNSIDIEQGVVLSQQEVDQQHQHQLPRSTVVTLPLSHHQQQYHHDDHNNQFGNNHRQRHRQQPAINDHHNMNHHNMNHHSNGISNLGTTPHAQYRANSSSHRRRNREYRGFDILRRNNYGLHRNEIIILRNYFNHHIDRFILNHPEIVIEVQQHEPYDTLLQRRYYEEAWMNIQGPYSEFRMNLNLNNNNHNSNVSNSNVNNNNSLFASLPSITSSNNPTTTTPVANPTSVINRGGSSLQMVNINNSDSNNGTTWTPSSALEQHQQQGPSILNNNNINSSIRGHLSIGSNPNHPHNGLTSTTIGTDRDFIWGFMLGFCVGFIMLVWLWIPTVPHKQKLGILTGYSFHLALGMLKKNNNQYDDNNNDTDYYDNTDELTLLNQYRNTNMLLLED